MSSQLQSFIISNFMNISILNLPRHTTEAQLVQAFKEYGVVESCDIVMDKQTGKSKGFGFIKMPNQDEANAAIAALHGKRFDGNIIRVKISSKEYNI